MTAARFNLDRMSIRRCFIFGGTWNFLLLAAGAGLVWFITWMNLSGYTSLHYLVAFKGVVASPVIAKNLVSDDQELMYSSLFILGQRRSRLGYDKAIELVHHKEGRGWIHGVHYLGALREEESVPLLIESLGPDTPSGLRDYSLYLLKRISGKNLGPSQAAWDRWWLEKSVGLGSDRDNFPDGEQDCSDGRPLWSL